VNEYYTLKIYGNEEVEGNVLCSKWLNMKEDQSYKIIINCSNVADLKII
jgi:hypothetical protein